MAANYRESRQYQLPIMEIVYKLRTIKSSGLRISYVREFAIPGGAQLEFTSGVSALSWGENITVRLTETANGFTMTDIISECLFPTQIIDWGKNKKNVTKLFGYLDAVKYRFDNEGQNMPTAGFDTGSNLNSAELNGVGQFNNAYAPMQTYASTQMPTADFDAVPNFNGAQFNNTYAPMQAFAPTQAPTQTPTPAVTPTSLPNINDLENK